jgi:hypothetical protein
MNTAGKKPDMITLWALGPELVLRLGRGVLGMIGG